MNDYDVVIVGGRVAGASTALLLARAGLRVAVLERVAARRGHRLHPRADARPASSSSPAGACFPSWSRPGLRAIRRTAFHYADGEDAPGVTLRSTPGRRRARTHHAGTSSIACSSRQPRPRAPTCCTRRRWWVCSAMTTGGSSASGCPATDGREVAIRAGLTVGADGIGSLVAREVGRTVPEPGAARPARSSTATSTRCPRRATSGPTATAAAAGLIPTNAGETCVFVATTPARMRPLRREGAEAAFDSLLDAVPAAAGRRRTSGRTRPVGCTAGAECRGTSVARTARGGPWSVTPATSRTRSPPTGSPMRSATRSCCRTRASRGSRRRVPGCRAGPLPGHPRPTVESVVRGDGVRLPLRLGRRNRSGRCCDG